MDGVGARIGMWQEGHRSCDAARRMQDALEGQNRRRGKRISSVAVSLMKNMTDDDDWKR